jgi:hypothetical protein
MNSVASVSRAGRAALGAGVGLGARAGVVTPVRRRASKST